MNENQLSCVNSLFFNSMIFYIKKIIFSFIKLRIFPIERVYKLSSIKNTLKVLYKIY